MRILFDYLSTQPYGSVEYHGGGAYGRGVLNALVSHLASTEAGEHELFLLANTSIERDLQLLEELSKHSFVQLIADRGYTALDAILEEHRIDVLYSPVPYHLPRIALSISGSGTRICGTIHGIRGLELQDDLSIVFYRRATVAKVKGVLRAFLRGYYRQRVQGEIRKLITMMDGSICTVSHHTKALLLTGFPELSPESLTVAYRVPERAERPKHEEAEHLFEEHGIGTRFFLCVSSARYEKNVLRVVRALAHFPIRDDGVEFVFLGTPEWQKRYFEKLLPTEMHARCHFLGYVGEAEYRCFLASAIALIYPSLSEGFGYPPIEAGYFGTPTIASGTTSIPEVCGDGALYVDPRSEQEIALRINELLTRPELREELSTAIKRRVEQLAAVARADEPRIVDYILNG